MEPIIPYGKQSIDEEDINEVVKVLKTDWLTTGPKVKEFEQKIADYVGAKYGIAVSNGTAALHLACLAAGLKKDEELITTPMTFAASANCALYCGAKPVFVEINEQGLIDTDKIEEKITEKTKIIIPVHYTGLVCDMEKIKEIADKHNLVIIEDACHSLGAKYKDSRAGDCRYSDMSVFSFHPVKHITTGEGGMITTNSKELYEKLLMLRNHGFTKDKERLLRKDEGEWYHEMQDLGFNYRITDIQCSLGVNQLNKLESFIKKRRELAKRYDKEFENDKNIEIIKENNEQFNAYHLYIIKLKDKKIRRKLFDYLKKNNIFCQIHYIPVYLHPYYEKLGYKRGLCAKAEEFYERIISLPLYPELDEMSQDKVIRIIKEFFENNPKVGVIIQARMSSSRLPNKVLLNLAGKPILQHVVERCKKADIDEVIVATSINKENDVIEEFCKNNNYNCFRGSEDDVLERYYEASKKFNLDIVIRETGDNPLLDPEIINLALKNFFEEKADYTSNAAKRSFPRGLDIEVFSFETLKKTNNLVKDKFQREHVTAFIYNHPEIFNITHLIAKDTIKRPEIRLCMDTEEDLKLLRIIHNGVRKEDIISIEKVIQFLDENPDLIKINLESEKEHLEKNIKQNIGQEFIK